MDVGVKLTVLHFSESVTWLAFPSRDAIKSMIAAEQENILGSGNPLSIRVRCGRYKVLAPSIWLCFDNV